MNLLTGFENFIAAKNLFQKKDRLLLAVSGGVDSVVLCDLCKQAGYDFVIAHCNFQLRGEESERDEKFVKSLANKYGAEVYLKHFDTKAIAAAEKKSIETAARDLRYQWFNELIAGGTTANGQPSTGNHQRSTANYILTAHHADDNIETVVMNFFRGTGIAGLHGILPKQGKIIRPLLFARRSEIEQYARHHKLEFVTDSTNAENEYTRNFFRNQVIPLVKESYPDADKNVLNNIRRLQDAEELYNQSISHHKEKLIEQKGNEIHIPVLKLLKTRPLATVLYEIIKDFDFNATQLDEVIALLESETGKYIESSSHRIIKNRKWLIIAPLNSSAAGTILIEEQDTRIVFDRGELKLQKIQNTKYKVQEGSQFAQLDAAYIKFPLLLRKWKQGDYFYPLGMKNLPAGRQGKKKLSRFFIDQKLSLTEKENIWVLEMNKKIIWVIGMRIDERFKITPQTKNILLVNYFPK